MDDEPIVSQEEASDLEAAAERVVGKGGVSWQSYLDRWAQTVQQVEQRYDFTIYDYINDLDARGRLQSIVDEARNRSAREKLVEMIAQFDARFMEATYERVLPLVGRHPPDQWWWNRVPRNAGPELERDLAN